MFIDVHINSSEKPILECHISMKMPIFPNEKKEGTCGTIPLDLL